MAVESSASFLVCRIYRSLLRASSSFGSRSPNSKVYSCLLYRKGLDDLSWDNFLRSGKGANAEAEGKRKSSDDESNPDSRIIFNRLVREIITGDSEKGFLQMQFPSHVEDPARITKVIRREFKGTQGCLTSILHEKYRRDLAFLSLRKLNEKLALIDSLESNRKEPCPNQAARFVSPLPLSPPDAYLRPGAFLIAHPMLSDSYFRKSVVFILSHKETHDQNEKQGSNLGTYGIIINRPATRKGTILKLRDVLLNLPEDMMLAFAKSPIREGGPVLNSLQMIHRHDDEGENIGIGGNAVPMIPESEDASTATHSNPVIRYRGDAMKAAEAVLGNNLDPHDVSFFVGASCWAPGQLESEVERGFWLPCRGPPEIAQRGACVYGTKGPGEPSAGNDLWLSMLAACGDDEKKLAFLTEELLNDYDEPCDGE